MRKATERDAHELAGRMRKADADEVMASNGLDPLDAVLVSLDNSTESWVLFVDGELVCIWGVAGVYDSALSRRGVAWMLTTPSVESKRKVFWRLCTMMLPDVLSRWDELVNAIDARHEQAIRWARRLGFKLEDPAPYGPAGLPFCRFSVGKVVA